MENKRTCLYDKHVALGALISPFGGFDMPIQYSNIVDEHQAVRQHCGVFDVSHMGEVLVYGTDAGRFVNHIFTNDIRGMADGKILYGMMCYEDGGVVDDLLVYKKDAGSFFLVINASISTRTGNGYSSRQPALMSHWKTRVNNTVNLPSRVRKRSR